MISKEYEEPSGQDSHLPASVYYSPSRQPLTSITISVSKDLLDEPSCFRYYWLDFLVRSMPSVWNDILNLKPGVAVNIKSLAIIIPETTVNYVSPSIIGGKNYAFGSVFEL